METSNELNKRQIDEKPIKPPPFVVVDMAGLREHAGTFTCIPPVILRSQLYNHVGDPTRVDRDLVIIITLDGRSS